MDAIWSNWCSVRGDEILEFPVLYGVPGSRGFRRADFHVTRGVSFLDEDCGGSGQKLACSIEAVLDELLAGNDELADWTRRHPDFFCPLDLGTTRHFAPLTAWAGSRDFTPAAITAFTGTTADYLLVAYAKEHEHILVTHERPDPNAKARIFIPDACIALGVEYADTFKMLRATGAHLDLRTKV